MKRAGSGADPAAIRCRISYSGDVTLGADGTAVYCGRGLRHERGDVFDARQAFLGH